MKQLEVRFSPNSPPPEVLLDRPGIWTVELRFGRHGSWYYTEQGGLVGQIEVLERRAPVQEFRLRVPAGLLAGD